VVRVSQGRSITERKEGRKEKGRNVGRKEERKKAEEWHRMR
jgi:hypothetical protein